MAMLWMLATLGCVDGVLSATMTGTVMDGFDGDARPLASGTVTVYDEDLSLIGSDDVDQEGVFELEVPTGDTIYAVIESEGYGVSSFKGTVGIDEETFEIDDGSLFAVSDSVGAEWAELWADCPDVGEGGAIIGEIRLYIPTTSDDLPIVTTGFAYVEDEDGNRIEACYLDDDGVYDPDSEMSGQTGQFAIFGVSSEHRYLTVGYYDQGYTLFGPLYQVWVEPGWVAPYFPAYVELPSR